MELKNIFDRGTAIIKALAQKANLNQGRITGGMMSSHSGDSDQEAITLPEELEAFYEAIEEGLKGENRPDQGDSNEIEPLPNELVEFDSNIEVLIQNYQNLSSSGFDKESEEQTLTEARKIGQAVEDFKQTSSGPGQEKVLEKVNSLIQRIESRHKIIEAANAKIDILVKTSEAIKKGEISEDGDPKLIFSIPFELSSSLATEDLQEIIPKLVERVPELTEIKLWGCSGLKKLPDNVGELKKLNHLEILRLDRCKLTELHPDLGELSLKQISASENVLTAVPVELFNNKNLETINLNANRITDQGLPLNIFQLTGRVNLGYNFIGKATDDNFITSINNSPAEHINLQHNLFDRESQSITIIREKSEREVEFPSDKERSERLANHFNYTKGSPTKSSKKESKRRTIDFKFSKPENINRGHVSNNNGRAPLRGDANALYGIVRIAKAVNEELSKNEKSPDGNESRSVSGNRRGKR